MLQAAGKRFARRGLGLVQTRTSNFGSVTMADEESKHRIRLSLYDMNPYVENCWVAPNSVVIGEVEMFSYASVWYNSVIRGDINKVR